VKVVDAASGDGERAAAVARELVGGPLMSIKEGSEARAAYKLLIYTCICVCACACVCVCVCVCMCVCVCVYTVCVYCVCVCITHAYTYTYIYIYLYIYIYMYIYIYILGGQLTSIKECSEARAACEESLGGFDKVNDEALRLCEGSVKAILRPL